MQRNFNFIFIQNLFIGMCSASKSFFPVTLTELCKTTSDNFQLFWNIVYCHQSVALCRAGWIFTSVLLLCVPLSTCMCPQNGWLSTLRSSCFGSSYNWQAWAKMIERWTDWTKLMTRTGENTVWWMSLIKVHWYQNLVRGEIRLWAESWFNFLPLTGRDLVCFMLW